MTWAPPVVALVVWWGAWVGWLWPSAPTAVAVAVASAGCLAASLRVTRPLLVLVAAAACVAALGASARQLPDEVAGRAVSAHFHVTGPPRQVRVDLGAPAKVSVPVQLHVLRLGSTVWRVDAPARMFARADDLPPEVQPGAIWAATGRIQPPGPSDISGTLELVTAAHQMQGPGPVPSTVNRLRSGLSAATSGGSEDASALVAGIALGDESGQSPQLARTMQIAGLSHLTAVSGGNFVIVLGVVLLVARLRRVPLPGQVALAASALVGYGVIVGPQPSVLRAATMAAAGLAGVAMGGRSRGPAVLSGCVSGLLLVSPELARSLGFALSVAATAGLLVGASRFGARLGRILPGRLAVAVAVATVAHLVTAPLLLAAGAPTSWVAVPANVAVAPLVGAITVLGLAAALLSAMWPPIGAVAGPPAVMLAELMVRVAEWAQMASSSPWVPRAVPLVVGVGALTALWWLARQFSGPVGRVPVAAIAAVVVGVMVRFSGSSQDWRVVACDVGQGTAVVVRTDLGPVLFDVGPATGDVSACLARTGVGDLAAVVISHFHADHVAGLPELLVARDTDQVLVPAGAADSATRTGVDTLLSAGGLQGVEVAAGDRWQWGSVTASVLWPPRGRRFGADDANNGSLVVSVEWPDGMRVLLPGDIEPESQGHIMRSWNPGGMDVVVMPHHGSDHQDPAFAGWWSPAVAVASAGAGNSYGHPAAQTLAEYTSAGASVWRTDERGNVVISVRDGVMVVE